ncbi:hypothetical protein [Spiroplasma endosymbiont of Seladonia tumulorum]|uniref:hypothetical protein n=1 Tax=Spiroplasma endosymbiont of Seladonia tumulorum TaxID=3066321 RepID=UPI0030D45919
MVFVDSDSFLNNVGTENNPNESEQKNKNLENLILNTDLGELPDNREEKIIKRLLELNQNIQIYYLNIEEFTNYLYIDYISSTTINIFEINGENDFNGVVLNFIPRISQISSVILNTDLGELPNNLPETILERLVLLNNNLNLSNINLSEITIDSAIISAIENSDRYLGSVIVQFTLNNEEVKTIKENENKQDLNSDTNDSVNKLISKFDNLNSNNNLNYLNHIKVLDKNTKGGNLKEGDTYIETNNWVYLKHGHGQIDKFDGLNFPIIDIELDGKGSAYVLNNTNEIYHLNLYGWGNEKIILPNNIKAISMKVLQKNSSENNNIKKGTIYIGTNSGVYFKSFNENDSGTVVNYKFDGLNFPIIDIELDGKGSAYVLNNTGEIYHLNLYGWDHTIIYKKLEKEEL